MKLRVVVIAVLLAVSVSIDLGVSVRPISADSSPLVPAACNGVNIAAVHSFDIEGGVVSIEPPAAFNPLTASSAELTCFGLPSRPQGGPALANWTAVMSHALHYVVPHFVSPPEAFHTGSICGTCSHNTHYNPPGDFPWSGYAMSAYKNGWSNLNWNEVQANWNVPYGHTYCTNIYGGPQDSPWVGLGGDGWDGGNGNALIQAGTNTYNDSPAPVTQWFWEDYNNAQHTFNSPTVSAGDTAYVDVHYIGNQQTTFFFDDETTTNWTSMTKTTNLVDLSSAEFINEPQPASWDFPNFGTVGFGSAEAYGTWGSGYAIQKSLADSVTISQFTAYKLGGDTSNHLVAWPTAPDSYGQFTDYATSNDTC